MINKILNTKLYWEKIKEKSTSQLEMSKLFPGSDRTFAAYVKTGNFSKEKLKKIADFLGTTVDELWIDAESPDKNQGSDRLRLLEDYKVLSDKYNKLMEANSAVLLEKIEGLQKSFDALLARLPHVEESDTVIAVGEKAKKVAGRSPA